MRDGKKSDVIEDLAKDLCFVKLVEEIGNVGTISFKKKHRCNKKKRLIQKAIACLVKMEILQREERSGSEIVQGDSDEIRGVVLKLLAWFVNP